MPSIGGRTFAPLREACSVDGLVLGFVLLVLVLRLYAQRPSILPI